MIYLDTLQVPLTVRISVYNILEHLKHMAAFVVVAFVTAVVNQFRNNGVGHVVSQLSVYNVSIHS